MFVYRRRETLFHSSIYPLLRSISIPQSSARCRQMSLLRRIFILLLTVAVAAADRPTVYEAIGLYGFPRGLIPKGVTSYKLDLGTGKFSFYLDKTCSFTIQGYDLKYKTTISGTISNNRIRNLTGIQVKILFLWLNIVEVTKDGDDLELSVGIASAGFPADGFEESPQCGCGFNCANSGGFISDKLLPLAEV